ncbi:5-beta-cholestane-3-alpha,7-alpha-diol 12-alpha-hydroxylase-like [Brienomyrus brachyistius]|uniref:5-beta-cholestane-3-alpha,7-alpha-diol 12-alpha-hydroxylase-like n=1 Tax=Brienomyrus brachyistius TaxID=42636 RepID=UPI0020B36B6E|nr:5-beta-cholestane-3-alpha,7-alpha-diol 12-alpha-hydroxylase-like [Brienomyrus brachyistius]
MAMLLPILLTLLACLIGVLYLLGALRRRRSGEPPLDMGPIPWLGHMLEFRKNTATFLQRMKEKHGDIFTAQMGGIYYTFVMDPLSFGTIVKESRTNLDFTEFAKNLVEIVFSYETLEDEHKVNHAVINKHLMGDGLVVVTQAMMNNLQNLMLHSLGQGNGQSTWQEDGLFHYSYNIIFRGAYLSLFGNEAANSSEMMEKARELDRVQSNDLFHEFRKYDKMFPSLVYRILPPWKKREVERLRRLFLSRLSTKNINTKQNVSGWVMDSKQVREELGMDPLMVNRYMFILLWTSQGNTGPASFWLLMFLMKHADAMTAVRKEVEEVLRVTGQSVKPGGPLINLTRDMLLQTPVLDSAVEESLRLTTAPMLIRGVKKDMSLKMANGREYNIRQGDRLALFPYTAVQIDPEIHPDPMTFKYNRFLTPEGTKKTDFYKNGKKVKFYSMPWGAGVSMCPGRFFATNELKQFVFLMLTYFDFELKNPEEEIPAFDVSRWGFGSIQPSRDIQFRYRLRF